MNKSTLSLIWNSVGGLAGLLSIALLVFKGGAVNERVQDHTRRIEAIEALGTPTARMHIPNDDQRDAALSLRVDRMDPVLQELRSTVAGINAKMDIILQQSTRGSGGSGG